MQLNRVLGVLLLAACLPTLPGEDAGTDAGRPIPPPAIDLAVGATHACARMADSTVRCWGRYSSADLAPITPDGLPVAVPALNGARRVALGRDFGCAYFGPGTRCWGANDKGQLGNGSAESSNVPVAVAGDELTDPIAGGSHACGRLDGGLMCWGDDSRGQVGVGGTTMMPFTTPQSVGGMIGAQVDLGETHGCARLPSGSFACWGENGEGQLGEGSNTSQSLPFPVQFPVAAVSAGRFTCALRDDQSVWCWGLGATSPAPWLLGDGGWQEIAVGGNEVCARAASGLIRCMQRADAGGDLSVPNPVQLGAGDRFSCARTDGGTVYCWGSNDRGQLGDGTLNGSATPVKVGF